MIWNGKENIKERRGRGIGRGGKHRVFIYFLILDVQIGVATSNPREGAEDHFP
jgi:hypothetical protein